MALLPLAHGHRLQKNLLVCKQHSANMAAGCKKETLLKFRVFGGEMEAIRANL